jgi:hypothetical protein
MTERRRVTDGRGRTWVISKVGRSRADAEDFRFWYEELSPEERVVAVERALESSLKAKGRRGVPRLRRVHRRLRRSRQRPRSR